MVEEVIPVLRVADAAAAVKWYERLGFTEQWGHSFEPGMPAFVSIACGSSPAAAGSSRGKPGVQAGGAGQHPRR